MLLATVLYSVLLWPAVVEAAWGYTDDGSNYVIDSGASLVVKVSKSTGDMTSIRYGGVEYNGNSGRNSHVESGLGASTVTIEQFTSPANIIKVTVVHGTLKHYLVLRYGNNNVYIFTNKADSSITVSRYIVRLPAGRFAESTDPDFVPSGAAAIEASDVTVNAANGYTYSKHYCGSTYGRLIDFDYVGRTSSSVGVFMIRHNHEKGSGGPFFRSLQRRGGVDGEDLYEIYHYNMGHTDDERYGLQGPSVLAFTGGDAPNAALLARRADWSWFDTLGISGWVPASGRGRIAGVGLSNMKTGFQYVAALNNSAAQYWVVAAASGGAWSIDKVLPGTYTLIIYKAELEVYTGTVTISAGGATALNTITCTDPDDRTAIWRIGQWDGTPRGLLNFADTPMKPTYMHPSDTRLASWNPPNFIVGSSAASTFPAYMWRDVNDKQVVYFRLTNAQLAAAHTLRIGITEAFIGGRPTVTVNAWSGRAPAATRQGSTRSLTVGTYRGNNAVLSWEVPASAWLQSASEWQVLTISIISGSDGVGYLSPAISIDAIDLL